MASSASNPVGQSQAPSLQASDNDKKLSAEGASTRSQHETISTNRSSSFNVIVHPYQSRRVPHTCLYELAPTTGGREAPPKHALLFIGGLGDGPHTVPMIRTVSKEMETATPDWSVFEVRLATSFDQWGFRSLEDDRVGIEDAVKFLHSGLGKEKVVLMGHSTGCQDCMVYAKSHTRPDHAQSGTPQIAGYILQAPVSDREYIEMCYHDQNMDLAKSLEYTLDNIRRSGEEAAKEQYMPKTLLPAEYRTAPITVYRWHSLTTLGGDDDWFTDTPDISSLGPVWSIFDHAPVLVLPSEKDECVPPYIRQDRKLRSWREACPEGKFSDLSGLVPGANHSVEQPEAQQWLTDRVCRFLQGLDQPSK